MITPELKEATSDFLHALEVFVKAREGDLGMFARVTDGEVEMFGAKFEAVVRAATHAK